MTIENVKNWSEVKEFVVDRVTYIIYEKSKTPYYIDPKVSDEEKFKDFKRSIIEHFDTRKEAEAFANQKLNEKKLKAWGEQGLLGILASKLNYGMSILFRELETNVKFGDKDEIINIEKRYWLYSTGNILRLADHDPNTTTLEMPADLKSDLENTFQKMAALKDDPDISTSDRKNMDMVEAMKDAAVYYDIIDKEERKTVSFVEILEKAIVAVRTVTKKEGGF